MEKNNLSIIDADTIIYIATYNKENNLTSNKVIDNCKSVLENTLNITKADKYCGFLTEGSSFRKDFVSSYKANRKDLVNPKYYKLAKAYLYDEMNFVSKYKYEADDLCIMSYASLRDKYNCIICSCDKDLRQVDGKFYDYRYNKFIEVDKTQANKNFWYQMLVGDVIDNISGCKGIGKIKANLLLCNVQNPWALRSIVLDQYIKTYKEYEGIIKFTENYRLCKMLTTTFEGEEYIPEILNYERNVEDGEEW